MPTQSTQVTFNRTALRQTDNLRVLGSKACFLNEEDRVKARAFEHESHTLPLKIRAAADALAQLLEHEDPLIKAQIQASHPELQTSVANAKRSLTETADKWFTLFAAPTYTATQRYKAQVMADDGRPYTIHAVLKTLHDQCSQLPDAPVHTHFQQFSVSAYNVGGGEDLTFYGDDIFDDQDYTALDEDEIKHYLNRTAFRNMDFFEKQCASFKKTSRKLDMRR